MIKALCMDCGRLIQFRATELVFYYDTKPEDMNAEPSTVHVPLCEVCLRDRMDELMAQVAFHQRTGKFARKHFNKRSNANSDLCSN